MAAKNDFDFETSSSEPVVVIQSSNHKGKRIIDCKQISLSDHNDKTLEKSLSEGWELVQIAWIRMDGTTNFGHEPSVRHVLRAVVVKTEKGG